MQNHGQIFANCFRSTSSLWNAFLRDKEKMRILYYPSADEDLRPLVFSNQSSLDHCDITFGEHQYEEPDLFIFSDYFPWNDRQFFDSRMLHHDDNTSIVIEEFCELKPNPDHFKYTFNREHVAFDAGIATGRAIFFKARVHSHLSDQPKIKYAIYFFFENVNLIDQLFLKYKVEISHLVWKRDGSGLGGGMVKHDFLYHTAALLNTKYYFLWDFYLSDEEATLTDDIIQDTYFPGEIKQHLRGSYILKLKKYGSLKWQLDDIMNFYIKV